jgi:hypothetical protein
MLADSWDNMVARMQSCGIAFEIGLTDTEVAATESRFAFQFPPDLRAFLQTALPQGRGFPNWRSAEEAALRDWLHRARDGIVFDIERNGFWLEEWGARPTTLAEAKCVAEQLVAAAPRLIPIYMHRMMPAKPCLPGNPVYSVHQTDIIIYGNDLRAYLIHEFLMTKDKQQAWTVATDTRRIAFWDGVLGK